MKKKTAAKTDRRTHSHPPKANLIVQFCTLSATGWPENCASFPGFSQQTQRTKNKTKKQLAGLIDVMHRLFIDHCKLLIDVNCPGMGRRGSICKRVTFTYGCTVEDLVWGIK